MNEKLPKQQAPSQAAPDAPVETTTKPEPDTTQADVPPQPQPTSNGKLPGMKSLTVEELYDKDKFDLSTMEPGDVFTLLQ
jgi:H+-transporting ATPase